jgi:hypothetical protein
MTYRSIAHPGTVVRILAMDATLGLGQSLWPGMVVYQDTATGLVHIRTQAQFHAEFLPVQD